jgi:N-acetylglucosamine kinase-like BadF-type ATPase
MILIGDSGATSTQWALYNEEGKEVQFFETEGLSPVFLSDEEIEKIIREKLLSEISEPEKISAVYFYGAGCARGSRQERMTKIFENIFSGTQLSIEGDLVAVARALCGNDRGMIAILGTGMASGLCDGGKIIDQVKSLGFYIGDEGSAAHLGRLIIQKYFYREMPDDLLESFEKTYSEILPVLTEELYASSTPSRYVGQFAKFASQHREHDFIQKLIEKNFQQFIDAHIMKYAGSHDLPLCVVGSVAHHFTEELKKVLAKNNLQFGKVAQDPIEGLVEYHRGS